MRTNADRNWEMLGDMLAAEASGKSPRLFASRRTLFGIPSALDQELASLDAGPAAPDGAKAAGPARRADDAGEAAGGPSEAAEQADANEPSKPSRPRKAGKQAKQGGPTLVRHPLEPVFDERSRTLVLGTMPSPASRETGFYYNHPQNRFWKVMAALFDEPLPADNAAKRSLALRHGIALWDVLAACAIEGASDGTIAECVPNDLGVVLAKAPIEAIFCTGAKAAELYRKYCEPATRMPCTRLPSTSPANAARSLDRLVEDYRVILPHCRP